MAGSKRLWDAEPRRRTCLSRVTGVRGPAFTMDPCLFRPTSRLYRHGQRADAGTVWLSGEKRRLEAVEERGGPGGELWHRLRGTVPAVGDGLQCQLDQDRRDLDSRAHTALHLALAALRLEGDPALAVGPEVKGGGQFRIDLAEPYVAPARLAAVLQRVNAWVADDRLTGTFHVPRDEAERRLTPQRYADGLRFPGPEASLRAVEVAGVCAYPCDGTHASRTSEVGRVVFRQAHPARGGFVLIGHAAGR